ncbi:Na+/H+ antiporter NhaA [Altererythrobacter sp.]|uniref:Na+/H+ antiporter NhaA n=1 Tax=Altererythrobacter sp. TaxID=1872480 RepID=UPI001B24BC0A|nr:Na+/H+ antiporter NhaA [Altererythrobacter sp.]MBO6608161.1 Na+/H+ antiporter NhaA [Altererythrobacter sp.]MBO6641583.1 Na+/H+ antiporter NhaA [Altererythrobacter sp.]MBO6707718.1 Na+/H+ antiporter NhaA [Altererythrobacter sp.]MBO6946150.1 Na+/H+ antiporter NhaA [Altererythrobacter sp.]
MVSQIAPMLREFMQKESAGGITLIFAAFAALIVANSPLLGAYRAWLDIPIVAGFGGFVIEKPLLLWVNDGLMAVFFFLIGLEVKREVLDGQLSSWDKASLPLVAAIGGMAIPAIVYLAINSGTPENTAGWAIPAATDIAFALGILALLGPRVPVALKALLLAIAVIDDIGAITIIALFYTGEIDTTYLIMGGVVFLLMLAIGRMRVASAIPYVLLAILMWAFILKSGVHATLAGVAAALTVPMVARNGELPLEHMEHALHPWVAFLVIPIFGFANAGVTLLGLDPMDALAPLPLGIALGLLIGKQVGILGFAWLAVKTRIASLPQGVSWRQIHGLSLFAAIGFTMSLFIGNLAFVSAEQVDAVKLGVLSGSTIAAITGFFLLRSALPTAEEAQAMTDPEAKAVPAE